jgi:hypothetical protein
MQEPEGPKSMIPDRKATARQTGFSDGEPFPGGGIFPHVGAEIAKTGVQFGSPGAFSRRRKKGPNRPNWMADLFPDGLLHVIRKKERFCGGSIRVGDL